MNHKFINYLLTGIGIFLVLGCNKSNDTPPPPAGPPPGIGVAPTCPAGSTFSPYGTCMGPNGNPFLYQDYSGIIGFYTDNWEPTKTLRISDSNAYAQFLQNAMGVCNRGQYNGGSADCAAWASGYLDVTMQAMPVQINTLRATFRAWPKLSPNFQWSAQFPSWGDFIASLFGFPTVGVAGAVKNPLVLDMVVSLINNSKGFEARGYGDYWTTANRSLIQIQVFDGKFESGGFNYQIAFGNQTLGKGTVFATGQFIRCSSPDCGATQIWGL